MRCEGAQRALDDLPAHEAAISAAQTRPVSATEQVERLILPRSGYRPLACTLRFSREPYYRHMLSSRRLGYSDIANLRASIVTFTQARTHCPAAFLLAIG